jgi:hypothetical protein
LEPHCSYGIIVNHLAEAEGGAVRRRSFLISSGAALALGATEAKSNEAQSLETLARAFASPPNEFRPIAAYQVSVLPANLLDQMREAFYERGYGSFLFSPSAGPGPQRASMSTPRRPLGLQKQYPPYASKWLPKALPGEDGLGSMARGRRAPPTPLSESPGYFTDAWFDRVEAALRFAKESGRTATFYDEVGFPSGMADHTAPIRYHRKLLTRVQASAAGDGSLKLPPVEGIVQAIVATDGSGRRVDLTNQATAAGLAWRPPSPGWRLEAYTLEGAKSTGASVDYYGAVDYMDPEASGWYIDQTYERLVPRLRPYLGSTITMSFFDDVGYFPNEKTWTAGVGSRFKAITGKDPAAYYPALWSDIGPETAAARVGFFKARAQLLGEGLPKQATEWARRYGVKSSGHAPGQYDPQPTDMSGDPFLFYKHVDIPMVDVIFGHGLGRDGFKLISSEAQVSDKPIVAAENFTAGGDDNGYRRTIEVLVRGMNRFVTSDRPWFEPIGKPADFAEWLGRCCMMLQGGRHVADVAIMYPIESLQAFYRFDAPENGPGLPDGHFISDDHDYRAVGEMLLDELHRDFTFLHPDDMGSPKLKVERGRLVIDNKVNRETFRAVVLSGGEVRSLGALRKLKAFYDAGGVVLATSRLPFKSAEFGGDGEVRRIIGEMFGVDPTGVQSADIPIHRNKTGGRAIFVKDPTSARLNQALASLGVSADVDIEQDPTPTAGNGVLSYLHRERDGAQVYFFGNSSGEGVDTFVRVRGRQKLEAWDPHTGKSRRPLRTEFVRHSGEVYTRAPLSVGALRSLFLVGRPA